MPIMKKLLLAALAAPLLAICSPLQAQVRTPFVETTTLTLFWGFSLTYISSTNTELPPLSADGSIDPDTLPSGNQVFTDNGRVRAYTGPFSGSFAPAGANDQFIRFLVQKLIREGQLVREMEDYNWQITAVREAPYNVRELASNPYRLFLTALERTAGGSFVRSIPEYGNEDIIDDPQTARGYGFYTNWDTGLTLTLGEHSGTFTESRFENTGKVKQATGSVTTAFTIQLGARHYEDPRHLVDQPRDDPEFNYHLKRNLWSAFGSGLITYNVRTVAQPLPAFVASTVSATGTGYFFHNRSDVEYNQGMLRDRRPVPPNTYTYAGIAPLRINMSNVQYQKRELFQGQLPPTAPSGLQASFNADDLEIVLSWIDTSIFESGFDVERSIGDSGDWSVVETLNAASVSYVDTDFVPGTTYRYRVRAFNDYGESGYTPVASVTIPSED
jgi:hypothetical protein